MRTAVLSELRAARFAWNQGNAAEARAALCRGLMLLQANPLPGIAPAAEFLDLLHEGDSLPEGFAQLALECLSWSANRELSARWA